MINRDTDLFHGDFARPPLIIAELSTHTHTHVNAHTNSRPALDRPLHVKQMEDKALQKQALSLSIFLYFCSCLIRSVCLVY